MSEGLMERTEMMPARVGRPRDEGLKRKILTTAIAQMELHGYNKLTVEGIAAACHAGKATLYRWWKGKPELIAEALITLLPPEQVQAAARVVVDLGNPKVHRNIRTMVALLLMDDDVLSAVLKNTPAFSLAMTAANSSAGDATHAA